MICSGFTQKAESRVPLVPNSLLHHLFPTVDIYPHSVERSCLCVDREVEIHEQQQRKCISYYRPHENPDDLCVCAAEVRQEMLDQKTVVAYHYYF
jgi:hypothetical protein